MYCAIDIETTGLEVGVHEIVQLAIVPLDDKLEPDAERAHIAPFIRPRHPERATRQAMETNGLVLSWLAKYGTARRFAAAAVKKYVRALHPGNTPRITPVGHNYAGFDAPFLREFLGARFYRKHFDYHVVDSMQAAKVRRVRPAGTK